MNRREFLNTTTKVTTIGLIGSISNIQTLNAASKIILPSDSIETVKSSLELKADLFLPHEYQNSFNSVKRKLRAVQKYTGYGNFNVLGFDDMLFIGRNVSRVGKFSKKELEFIESIFYYNPASHGFFGDRITYNLTEKISKKYIKKIPYSGHYLYKGKAIETFERMQKDVGNSLVLTSGVRSVVKQMKLFLDKIARVDENISKAARSIAPPAFTYHSIGDFDVGKKGFGYDNFTSRFAMTKEFRKMRKLKYIDMRYTVNNKDGVRYEPWHVKTI